MNRKPALLLTTLLLAALCLPAGAARAEQDFHGWAMGKLIGMGCVGVSYTMHQGRDAFQGKTINPAAFMELDILDVSPDDKVMLVKWDEDEDRYKLMVWRKARHGDRQSVYIGRDGKKKDSGFQLKFD
ncbi:MAG: hypothetical protein KJ720_02360 [Proteobacteria bacterium]|nr:hypothetical protein [Pseudomonadota bacterium]MBU1449343.1 hypothetical protein [Pseudomonadota bacterium]